MRWNGFQFLLIGVFVPVLLHASSLLCFAQPAYKLPPPRASLGVPDNSAPNLDLNNLIQIGLENNPTLQKVNLSVDIARGQALQAGLYPNPVVGGYFDELGDRTGRGGINTAAVQQEIVTAKKLQLSRAVKQQEISQADLAVLRQRMALFTTIRKGYFEVLAIQKRIQILERLRNLADQAYENAKQLEKAKQIAKLDVIQFRVARQRLEARLLAANRNLLAAWQSLAAEMGVPDMPYATLNGSIDMPLPDYDLALSKDIMLAIHPAIKSAEVEVVKSEIALHRASVQKIPNVFVGLGYTRQNQNKSDDWMTQVEIPLPVFDRNQGNVLSAKARLGQAFQEVTVARNSLLSEIALAYGKYSGAVKMVTEYRNTILNDTEEAFKLSLLAFRGGEFEYLKVLQAQQAIAEANLEYIDALSSAWQAACELSGLIFQEQFPISAVAKN